MAFDFVLPKPEFGAALPVPAARPDVLKLMSERRSTSAFDLSAPGPDDKELDAILMLAARAPDHGKLSPWRFIVLDSEFKAALRPHLEARAQALGNPAKALATLGKLFKPPISVMVVSRPLEAAVPIWEQQLSAGAVCFSLLLAAHMSGYGANWITDWYAYDDSARALFGLSVGEQPAGFIHMGTPAQPPRERARPALSTLISRPTADALTRSAVC